MQAIILVGGLGTRLRSIVSDVPKPMAEIVNKPFVEYVLDGLQEAGITEVIFAVGYKGAAFEEYFGNGDMWGIKLKYVYEDEPLGTAGAIKNAVTLITGSYVLVLNGDTYYELDYKKFIEFCTEKNADMGIALRRVSDVSRYSKVAVDNDLIVGFNEKTEIDEAGVINGGVYLLKTALVNEITDGVVSLEKTMIQQWICEKRKIVGTISDTYFIDIGIPEDYFKFISDVSKNIAFNKKQLREQGEHLIQQRLNATSTQFLIWKDRMKKYLRDVYGVQSDEYKEFVNEKFIPQSVNCKDDYREVIIDYCNEKILEICSRYLRD